MIAIVGATGNVGGKITELLKNMGEPVRLVARSSDRLAPLTGNRAVAFAGDANDTNFLAKVFMNADSVFTLIPPNPNAPDFIAYANKIGESIAHALEISKVKHVVNLSSIGAELAEVTGPIKGLHNMEERLSGIKGLNVLNLRPTYFMENLLWDIDLIKSKGINGAAIRGDLKIPMIATKDIASFAADRLVKRDFWGATFQDLQGPRALSMIEATEIIGGKIDKPGLSYFVFPYGEAENGMIAMGLSPDVSRLYTEMSKAFNDGLIKQIPRTKENTTTTSLEAFCEEVFLPLFKRQKAA